ncbi:MAG TPA: cysteine desulfurase family protein [Chitinophagales bacterium]|mgnify:CR=1 FL=1|nr:cysteine desulfurase family protein [Chitinophagales bacterium]HRK26626.1 cysteine desulfurase family protein [Chitinophagales bacterium]
MIYLDNAATTSLHPYVLEAMMPYLTTYYGNPSSIHAWGRKSRAAIEKTRKIIAQCLSASVGEIFFTSGGTEATNTILWGAVAQLGVKHFITSAIEHHCVLHTLQTIAKNGAAAVHYVPLLPGGHINIDALTQLLRQLNTQPTMVALMHANNEIGNLLPLQEVANLCKQYNTLFYTDTVQTFGYYPINVHETPISFLSGSAHKFHGPKGVGFMYINQENGISPFLHGGSQERNMRAGTENVYGIVGLGAATQLAHQNMHTDAAHIKTLKQYMLERLTHEPFNAVINGDANPQNTHYKILNVRFSPPLATDLLLLNLDIEGICASGGSACSSGVDVGSHVLEALQVHPDSVNIRFSFSRFTTLAEIDLALAALKKALRVG